MKKLCFYILAMCLMGATCEEKETSNNRTNGTIVGYTKCDTLLGLYIITEQGDSLLSFNVPISSIGIDSSLLSYGTYNIDGGSINFDYRIATEKEIKQNFLCPQNAMLLGFSHGQTENYTQIIITDIKR